MLIGVFLLPLALTTNVEAQNSTIPTFKILVNGKDNKTEFSRGDDLEFQAGGTFENTLQIHVQVRCTRKIYMVNDGGVTAYLVGDPMSEGEPHTVFPGDKIEGDDLNSAFIMDITHRDNPGFIGPVKKYFMSMKIQWRTYENAIPGQWHDGESDTKSVTRKEDN